VQFGQNHKLVFLLFFWIIPVPDQQVKLKISCSLKIIG
jgi:hypothetical protein